MKGLRTVYWLVMVLFSAPALAQFTKVSGRVFDAETKEPLPFVSVIFKGTKVSATSDIDGNYTISTSTPSDSLLYSYVGYVTVRKAVKKGQVQVINVELKNDVATLNQIDIMPGENPAVTLLKKVIKNKPKNDKEKLDSYQYEVYNKIEFDLNNIPKDIAEKKMAKQIQFIFDYIDSSNVKEKPYLPLFISEAISDYYYKKSPRYKKEIIKASKISGLDNEKSVSQFMGEMYQNVNIYDNNILVFGKNFVSPISDNGTFFYKYYLLDSVFLEENWCYQVQFKPKRKQELLFEGNMWIADSTFGVKRLEMSIVKDANINYVNMLNVVQEYEYIDSTWMQTKDKLVVDFKMQKKQAGFYGRKTTSYRNIVINKPREDDFYSKTDNLIVMEDATTKSDTFWVQNRHDTLSKNEKQIYRMVDSLQNTRLYRTWQDIVIMIYSGYKVWGYVEYGPYYNMLSFNSYEGVRPRFGLRTSNKFSRWCEISGYVAYGTQDQQFKYGGEYKTFITKKPRQIIYFNYKKDYELLGASQSALTADNILTSLTRRTTVNSLTGFEQFRIIYEYEPFEGWNNKIFFTNRTIRPLGDPYTYIAADSTIVEKDRIITSEIKIVSRFAWNEKYIEGTFTRSSMGTKAPVIIVEYTPGLKGVLKSDYTYQKLYINIDDRFRINPIGYTNYVIDAGIILGKVPYPLMFLHPGNETYIYDWASYNLMNYYEFASDRYAAISIFHHFDGFFLNKVPLLRKLKWREVFIAKAMVGSITPANRDVLIFPSYLSSLNRGPYYEVGAGLENIFKIFRVDCFWRLSYIDREYQERYETLSGKKVNIFGVRASVQVIF
ncbi:MAG: DUF5686 family protein [Bacteroidota bacterium]